MCALRAWKHKSGDLDFPEALFCAPGSENHRFEAERYSRTLDDFIFLSICEDRKLKKSALLAQAFRALIIV